MIRTSFNDDWRVRPKVNHFMELVGGGAEPWVPVRLPHDAMIGGTRDPKGARGNGFFPGGVWEYQKTFVVPETDRGKRVLVEFEGVYRGASVCGERHPRRPPPYGYIELRGVDRRAPALRRREHDRGRGDRARRRSLVLGRRDLPDRPSRRRRTGAPRARRRARDHARRSTTTVRWSRSRPSWRTTRMVTTTTTVTTEIVDDTGTVVARDVAPLTVFPGRPETLRQRLFVAQPRRWSVDQPALYTCRTVVAATTAPSSTATSTDVRHPHHRGRPRAWAAHQRRAGRPARRVHPPRQRRARRRHDRARRRAARREAQGGGLQRAAQRAPPDEPGDARRVRPPRHARDGRDLRHVDRAQDGRRLLARVPRLVAGRRRRDGAQGPQPPLA